ncbi:MAG TPA: hypothetical protein VGR91_16515 [Stellaceae bacterium]|nr:hypothetical protein [Stellaceae bacterium]
MAIASVSEWIAAHGVTRCPTAAVARTQGSISAADRDVLLAHAEAQLQRRRAARAAHAAKRAAESGIPAELW